MLITWSILILAGLEPGPLDAFRANYAATKVDLDYRYRTGYVDASAVAKGQLWAASDLGLIESPEFGLEGHWACDGAVEYFRYSSPADVAAEGRRQLVLDKKVGKSKLDYTPSYEGLYDGGSLAGHHFDEPRGFPTKMIYVFPVTSAPGMIKPGSGPFTWWNPYPFPWSLKASYPGGTPSRHQALRGGHPTDVEVYRKQNKSSWGRLEVAYDPSVGYLPRYARQLASLGPDVIAHEYYLVEARPCVAGGFVPVEWYATSLDIDGFSSRYPSYDSEAELTYRGRIGIGHFLTLSDYRY